jgi:hypothetical protein
MACAHMPMLAGGLDLLLRELMDLNPSAARGPEI